MCTVEDLFWKNSGRLADGREIIYFDEAPGLGRAGVPDRRRLAAEAGPAPPGRAPEDDPPPGAPPPGAPPPVACRPPGSAGTRWPGSG